MFNSIRLGIFLAFKSIRHASKWTTSLIIFVMLITFLNLVVVSGILVGLIQGSEVAFREKYFGDVVIGKLEKKKHIEKSQEILQVLDSLDAVKSYSARYTTGGTVEANYTTRGSDDVANKKSVSIRGIDPEKEDAVTHMSKSVIEGEYLTREDASKYILLGKDVLAKYSVVADVDSSVLRNVEPGTTVRIAVNSSGAAELVQPSQTGAAVGIQNQTVTNEYKVKGIVKIKAGDLSSGIFMVDSELRKLANIHINDVDEIAIVLKDRANETEVKNILLQNGFGDYAKIQTFEESTPAFVVQMKQLFGALGTLFGSIGIVVAAITLFIVIFINALTRRRQIGILKGIGISGKTIIWSYVFQSIFYAILGSGLGLAVTFLLLKPAFAAHPIDFPFSDGILVAEWSTTLIRVGVLVFVALLAGFIPAWMVVRRNTLDAILGR